MRAATRIAKRATSTVDPTTATDITAQPTSGLSTMSLNPSRTAVVTVSGPSHSVVAANSCWRTT